MSEASLRADIVEIGRRVYARGYVASNDGNISVRLEGGRILTTPTGVSKGFMTPEMMVVTDLNGRQISGERKASSELLMHIEVYRSRPDIQAVVHAHPPLATGFAVAGIPLDRAVLAEVVTTLGAIPIAEYGTPSTQELADAVRQYIRAHDGLLLANHGALTAGTDLFSAYYKMETVEHFAKISLVARLLGREHLISREEVARLQKLRGTYGISAPAPICADDADPGAAGASCQAVQAPAGDGLRLVPDVPDRPEARRRPLAIPSDSPSLAIRSPASFGEVPPKPLAEADEDAEIRLTYRELSALIEDAIRSLK